MPHIMSLEAFPTAASIAVIGVGQVGGATAYALVLASHAKEVLLVDIDAGVRNGQVRDLSDAAFACNSRTKVREATHREASRCDVIIITAGAKFSIGQTTIDLTYRNISMVRNIIDAMSPIREDAILILASNPVDLLTTIAQETSGLSAPQVIGTGTFLDSTRLRGIIAERAKIAAQSVSLYVLGIHGDAQVVAWSRGSIGANPIDNVLPDHKSIVDRAELEIECKHRSQQIIHAKGATPFGIASVIASLCSSIIFDKRNVRPVSHYQPRFGCALSMPAAVGRKGIVKTFPMVLNSEEEDIIVESAKALRETAQRIGEDFKGR